MKSTDQTSLLRDESVAKALFKLSVPSILTSLVMTLYNLVDTIYVSQMQDNAMIAATSVALPVMTIIQAFGDGVGAGSGSYLGRVLGAKEEHKVKATVSTAMTLALIISVFGLIGSLSFLRPLINVFTDDPMVALYANQYVQVLTGACIFSVFKQILSYILRSTGDVRFPMVAISTGVVLNILLDPIFMFDWGLGLKIRGAALATVVSQAIASIMMMVRLVRHQSSIRWKFCDFRIDETSLKEILSVGSAVFVRNGLPSMSFGLFAKSAGLFGTDFVAAAGLGRKGGHMATFIIYGIAQGFQPFASYNFGAKKKKRLIQAMKTAVLFNVIYGAVTALLFIAVPELVMLTLTRDTVLIEHGILLLRCTALSMPMLGIYQVMAGSFQAMGKGKISFFTSILRQGLLYWPLMILLPKYFGVLGFCLVTPVCDWLSALIALFFSRTLIQEIRAMEEIEA